MEYRETIKYSIYAITLIIIQLFIFNYVHLSLNITASVFVILIFLLPVRLSKLSVLLIAFIYGLIFDILNNSLAIYTASLSVVAFVRPYLLELIRGGDVFEANSKPSIKLLGFFRFAIYSFILLSFFHFIENLLDIFSFKRIGFIILKTSINSIFSLFFVLFLCMTFYKND